MSRHEQVLLFRITPICISRLPSGITTVPILIHPAPWEDGAILDMLKAIRDQSGDEYFIMMHGDPTFDIPRGDNMMEFSSMLYEEPEEMHRRARARLDENLRRAEWMAKYPGLLDGFALCSDYCFNTNPFFSPAIFAEFIARI